MSVKRLLSGLAVVTVVVCSAYLGYAFQCNAPSCKNRVKSTTQKVFPWERAYKEYENSVSPPAMSRSSLAEKVSGATGGVITDVWSERYVTLNGHVAEGLKPIDTCRRKGHEILGRIGVRYKFQILGSYGVWLDARLGLGHQNYLDDNRNKLWLDVRQLYFSTRNPMGTNMPGVYLSIGRIPVADVRGFWFYNSLDSIKAEYLSTQLNGFVLVGTRFNDSRVSNSQEQNNIKDYDYLIGNLDYQFRYANHAALFFVKEYSDIDNAVGDHHSVWEPAKPKNNLTWLGLRLRGAIGDDFEHYVRYWLDVAGVWGRTQNISEAACDECGGCRYVTGVSSTKAHGIGGELGALLRSGDFGVGAQIGFAGKKFIQTRLSNNRAIMLGPTTVRYFGQLANPDLSNIVIAGLFGGYRVRTNDWLELNLLKYMQYSKDYGTYFSRYLTSTNGNSRDLGYEADLIYEGEVRETASRWRYNVVGSYFRAGSAFNDVDSIKNAYSLYFDLKYYW